MSPAERPLAAPQQAAPSQAAPMVLLPYQRRWVADQCEVKVAEKSRRVGLTWAQAADDVLAASTSGPGGMDVLYISYNLAMTREYIRTCLDWAGHFDKTARLAEGPESSVTKACAYRVDFESGRKILALSGRPTNLRGKQGRVVIDEAAFVDDLAEILKAALALLMWGGQVAVISTHNGADNPFNLLVQDIRAGRLPYSLHRVTLADALDDGLYRRICLTRGAEWSAKDQADWEREVRGHYGDGAAEELDCEPARGSGSYLTSETIEAAASPHIPVLRFAPPCAGFVDWPEERRSREVEDFCRASLAPLLAGLDREGRSYLGEDFGRLGDLTVLWPLVETQGLTLATPFVVELRDVPFRQQEQVLFHVLDRLPRLTMAALDASGNGMYLAEVARQRYSQARVREVKLSEGWYREHMPRLKAALEDRRLTIPRDRDIRDDLRAFRMTGGVAKLPQERTGAKGSTRHGDSGVALALAVYAATAAGPSCPPSFTSVSARRSITLGGTW